MMHMTWLLTFMIKSDLVVSAVLCPHGRTDVLSLNKRRTKIEVPLPPTESILLPAIRSQHRTQF